MSFSLSHLPGPWRVALTALAVVGVPEADEGAQDPPRQCYVFQVCVDPIYGDDWLASVWNTTYATEPAGLGRHRDDTSPNPITGFLQHASYSFKTLTSTEYDRRVSARIGRCRYCHRRHSECGESQSTFLIIIHAKPAHNLKELPCEL